MIWIGALVCPTGRLEIYPGAKAVIARISIPFGEITSAALWAARWLPVVWNIDAHMIRTAVAIVLKSAADRAEQLAINEF